MPRDFTFSTSTIRNLPTEVPGSRNNASLESYGAAVLALGSKQDDDHGIFGKAIMVAPGVALTAWRLLSACPLNSLSDTRLATIAENFRVGTMRLYK